MGYGSQDGYDWMMDSYGYDYNRNWWMPAPIETDYDTGLITGDDLFGSSADPYFGGFTLGFDDVSNAFEILDKDIFNDYLTYEDYNTLTNLGLDADSFITDSFGSDALTGLLINGEDIDPTLNPSISRQDILRMTPTSQAGHERKMLAAREELAFLENKRAQDNIRNQIDKAYGFATAEITIDPNTGQTVGVGSFYDRENASQLSLDIAAEDLRAVIQDFVNSPNYDARFHEIDTREYLFRDESSGYTPDMPEYGQEFENPNYNKPIISEDLINDFRYGVDEITEEDVEEAVNRIDLTFGVNTGETRTDSGYFVAIALDLLGMNKVGTSMYLTQNAYNYVINGIERITNKILGTGFDFPNLNIHEIAAEVLNQKFKDKDGNPILEGIADKTSFLFPFHDPTVTLALSGLGGENLGKFDPTGENIFDHIGDALLEGNILDAVQEQSEAGKFEGVEANRRTGARGLLDNISSFVQNLGVAGQKIFGPGLSQLIIDNAIFKGYPVSGLFNGIANSLGPQSAKDWVRYFENKGIDPNAVEEKDISWWRKTFDEYLKSDEYTASGKTGLNSLLDDSSAGGLTAKYLSAFSAYVEEITNKPLDRMQPAELISVLNDQVQSVIERGEINDLLSDENKLRSNLSIANNAAEMAGEPPMSLSDYRQFLENELKINQTGQVTFGDNNEYYFDLETVNNLKQAFPSITDSQYEAGFDYLISEGEQGQAFTEGVGYDITSDAAFYASDYVDEGDYIVMRDVPAVASYFEYRTNEQGDEFVYDPMSGVTYEFEQARLFDEPGTRDDLYTFPSLSAEDLRNSDRTLNKEILKELALTGKLEYKELKDLVTPQPGLFGAGSTKSSLNNIDLELGDYYLKKYAGLTDEELKNFNQADYVLPGINSFVGNLGSRTDQVAMMFIWNDPVNPFGQGGWRSPTLEYMLMLNGYTDENFDVLPTNEAYDEDYTEESIFELRPFEVIEEENGVPLVVADTIYGFTEDYDPNRLNANTGEYLFREYSYDELKYKPYTSKYLGGGSYQTVRGQSRSPLYTNPIDRARVLKSLLEQGKITEQEAEDLDWSYYLATNPTQGPAGYDPSTGQPYGNYTTIDDVRAGWRESSVFYNPGDDPNLSWRDSEEYAAIEVIDTDTPLDYQPPVVSFYDLPDFVVTDFNDINTLSEAYQDRLDFIDSTNFDFSTKEFLKDSASRLYNSRKAFIELDETSQQLILEAQANATSDFVDLGVFNVTTTNRRALDAQLNARMNIINAADLSEGQKQYEIDLANAIYNSKLSEINTLTSKNLAIATAENARDAAIQREGAASQTAADLQARIKKIEAYEIPEFNVTAYLNAEDPSAYMQNFVDEVRKGTTEEFGNFLSIENADQILVNVANLAQSEKDLKIVTGERDKYYEDYKKYLGDYNTAINELNTAKETLEANKIRIADLEADLYVELENFEVTATDIEGAQGQLNDFNTEIDRMVTDGEITSEQGELEKSLATNSFNVYKATQDISALQTSSDITITGLRADLKTAQESAEDFEQKYLDADEDFQNTKTQLDAILAYTLPDFTVEGVAAEDLDSTLDAYENALTQDLNAELINQEQYNSLYNSATELIESRKSVDSFEAEADEFEGKYNTTKANLEANQAYQLPDFNVFSAMETMGYVYSDEKGYFENPQGLYQTTARDAWVEDYEQQLIDDGILTQEQITNVVDDVRNAIFARQSRAFWKSESKKHEGDLAEAESRIGELETYTLPDFTVEGVAAEDLDGTLSAYQTALDNDLNAELINQEQYNSLYNSASELIESQKSVASFEAQASEFEGKYNTTKADLEANQAYVLPDFNTTAIIRDVFGFTQDAENDRWIAPEGFDAITERFAWLDNFEKELRAAGILTDQQIANILPDVESALWARVNREMKNARLVQIREELSTAQGRIGELESYTLPDFNTYDAMVAMGYNWNATDKMFDIGLDYGADDVEKRDAFLDDYEATLIDQGVLSESQRNDVLDKIANAIWSRQSREHQRNLYKDTQTKLGTAESRIGELESYTLPDFTVEGVAAENLDGTLSAYAQALTQDLNAELINQEQYNALYGSASELVLGQKALNDANADYAVKEKELNDKYDDLQAQYIDYKLPDMRVTGGNFVADLDSVGYYSEDIDLQGSYGDVWRMPDVPAEWTGTDYQYRKSLREQLVDMKRDEFYDTEGNSVLTEAQIDDLMDDYRYAVEYWQSREAWLGAYITKTKQYNTLKTDTDEKIRGLEQDVEGLQTFSLPEFNITATNQVELDAYLDRYQGYVDAAEKAKNISAEQALNFDTIIASIRNNGSQIFTLEAANKGKQDKIDELEGVNKGLDADIKDRNNTILDLTGTISVIGSGFDVTSYDDIGDLDAGLALYIQGINNSDLDEEMKASQIAFAQSMAEMRRENLYVPTYEAPDFNVVAEGDLTGLNTSYEQAMFTLNSFLDNEYITQEEYDANVADLNTAYNTRKDVIIPAYELPEFTVSELDAEGGFTNLDAEKEEFLNELQGFLDNDYITREEYDALEAQIESAYDTKKRDITPVYQAPDFTVYDTKLEPGEDFSAIDAEYNTARNTLDTNARLGYISSSEYIDQLNQLETSYEDARKGIAPTYELPDFSVYGDLQEGDDFTEIDTAYQNELTRLEEYRDSGYISLSEYYGFLGDLETEYTARREGILPTYTMPDFSVTPASSLAELAEMEQAARDRFTMFSESEYFPEDFDILTEQGNLESLFDAERARLQGTYILPEFAVEDTKGLLKQSDIENLFGEYEEGLKEDVVSGMLGLTDFFSAMEGAQTTFDVEFAKRKPIQPREGDYAIIPDSINEGEDDQPSTGDFFGYVNDGNYPDQYGTIGGIDTSDILTGNYMAKLDPAYQLAELLLGQDAAKKMYPTGKSRGLADEEFQNIVNQFMLGQAEDAFEMQSGLSGKMQDLATEQRRLQRQADLDLMAEFGDPYRQQLQELYPEQAAALKQQREIADIAAERAKGDLSPREQAQVEQQGYLFGAGRGREFDPVTLYKQLGEEVGVREGRETQATNQLTALMNMERGMYGDLPSVIGAQSPFIEGVGDITTPFNIGGIMDLGSTDYANQQKLQEVNMAIAQLDRDYQTAVALNQPSQAKSTLVKLNEYKAMADALGSTISAGQEAFGTLGSILGGVTSFFNRGKSKNEAMMPSKSSAFLRYLDSL